MTPRGKKRLFAAAACIALVLGLGLAYQARMALRQRGIARALEIGMAAYQRRDYAEAMTNLSVFVGRNRTNAKATLALADCRRRSPLANDRHLTSALAYARSAAEADPQDPKPLEMMLEICGQLGFATEAKTAAERLLTLDPGHLPALMTRTQTLASVGKTQDALQAAQDATTRHPESLEAHDLVVHLKRVLNEDTRSILSYASSAAAAHPQQIGFALLECRIALLAGEFTPATDAVRRAASLPIRTTTELAGIIRYLELLRMRPDAAGAQLPTADEILARALSEPALARDAALLQAERNWKLGRPEAAAQSLPSATADESARGVGLRAMIDSPAGPSSDDAIAALAERDGTDAEYWAAVLKGRRALAKSEYREAVTELRDAAARQPAPGFAQFFLGQTLAKMGDWRAAANRFAEAAQTDPTWWSAQFASITLLSQNGEFEEARKQAAAALSASGYWPQARTYFEVTVAMLEAGQGGDIVGESVLKELERPVADQPGSQSVEATLLALRARALLALGREREAMAPAEELLSLKESPDADCLSRLAVGFRRRGNAIADRVEGLLVNSGPGSVSAPAAKARGLAVAGKLADAVASLRQAAPTMDEGQRAPLMAQLGQLLDAMGDTGAVQILADLAASEPSNVGRQLALLGSQTAWSNEQVIADALGRLEATIGRDTDLWRVHDCRRMLAFPPADERARNANAARIVTSLSPVAASDPRNDLAAMLLADAQMILEDREGAIRTLARCLDSAPRAFTVYPRLIDLLRQAGRADEAERRMAAFRTARDLPLPLQRKRAQLLLALGMLPQHAEEIASLAARGGPHDRLEHAKERANARDTATAKRLFAAILADEPVSFDAVLAAAEFAASQEGIEAGLAVLDRAPPGSDATELGRVRAGLLSRHGRAEDAERLLRQRAADKLPGAWADLTQFYLTTNRLDEAAAAAQSGLAETPGDKQLAMLGAIAKIRAGKDPADSARALAAVAETSELPPDVKAITAALQAFDKDADEPKLIATIEETTRKFPASFGAWRLLANACGRAGRTDDAVKAALGAARSIPGDPRAAQLAAEVLLQVGRIDEANAMATKWRELAKADPYPADLLRARLSGIAGRFSDAAAILSPWESRITAGAEKDPGAVEIFAAALAADGREERAAALLGPRVHTEPAWGARYLRVGTGMRARPDAARAWLSKLEPSSPPELVLEAATSWFSLASASGQAPDFERVAAFARLAGEAPNCKGPAHAILAAAYQSLGKLDDAAAAYRIAVKEMPEDAAVANNLAYLLASRPGDVSEAVICAQRAVDLATKQRSPDTRRREFLDTLGFALVRAGRFKEAAAAFQAGLLIDPLGLDLAVGMIEARIGLGETDTAQDLVAQVQARASGAAGGTLTPDLEARLVAAKRNLPNPQ